MAQKTAEFHKGIALEILDTIQWVKDNDAKQVLEIDLFQTREGKQQPSPQGLYGPYIFGYLGSFASRRKVGFIYSPVPIIHPLIIRLLDSSIGFRSFLEQSMILDLETASFKKDSERKIRNLYELAMRFDEFIESLKANKKDLGKGFKRILDLYENYDFNMLFPKLIPVMPIAYRPYMVRNNRLIPDPITELYQQILLRVVDIEKIRLQTSLESTAQVNNIEELRRDLQRCISLQYEPLCLAVYRLYKFLMTKKIPGKSGVLRSTLMSKRVQFTARAVLVPGPELELGQAALPYQMAMYLFTPFIAHEILFNNKNIETKNLIARKLNRNLTEEDVFQICKDYFRDMLNDDEIKKELERILEYVVQDKVVLIKRDPTLHRLSWQAFDVVLHKDGPVIKLHPAVFSVYNADCDGDIVGVYVPLSVEAQQEAREKLHVLNNLIIPRGLDPAWDLSKEVLLGLWLATKPA